MRAERLSGRLARFEHGDDSGSPRAIGPVRPDDLPDRAMRLNGSDPAARVERVAKVARETRRRTSSDSSVAAGGLWRRGATEELGTVDQEQQANAREHEGGEGQRLFNDLRRPVPSSLPNRTVRYCAQPGTGEQQRTCDSRRAASHGVSG